MSYDHAIERIRRLDEIEAELKTIEKKLYWQRTERARQIVRRRRDDAVAALLWQFERDARL